MSFQRTSMVMVSGGPAALRPLVIGDDLDLDNLEWTFALLQLCIRVVQLALLALMDGQSLLLVRCVGCEYDHVCW